MNRKAVFDAVRKMLGRGFTPAEVKALDAAIDDATGTIVVKPVADAWVALAAPLIEQFEGMARKIPGGKVTAYPDPGTGGEPWTIGIGSTTDENGNRVKQGDVWTEDRARARFRAHLQEFGHGVDKALAGKSATPAQKAALVSLAYNIGLGAFGKSTVLKRHRAGWHDQAAQAFGMWVNAGGKKMPGLVRRREAEAKLYRGQA